MMINARDAPGPNHACLCGTSCCSLRSSSCVKRRALTGSANPAPHSDTFAMFLVACNRMTVAESSRVLPDEAAHPHLAYGARGQPPAFNPDAYRHRDQVERGSNRRKHGRGLVTRNDKLGIN
jgi:hypothetical protein